jgi:DNA polymerase I
LNRLVLIDGNAIVHRAYHALPPLHKTEEGQLTNAVYGFFSMTLKIVGDLAPDNLIVCFDRAAPTFRKQMYVGYQATRPKMEDDLSGQFKIIHEVLEKSKICVFELDGYEADDLIGTLSRQAIEVNTKTTSKQITNNNDVIILTGDRDLLQLVNHRVRILAPITGVTKMILFDSDKVKEKYGLEPSQFVDYKALVGDPSDNYPGVTGIGPKGAANLLNEFKSLEGIYKNLENVNPKIAEKLATDAEQSALAKKLATIELNAPIKLKMNECRISDMDKKALLASFQELSFNSLIDRFKLDNPTLTKASLDKRTSRKEKNAKEKKDQLGLL